ncbi:MAG: hypothetical protein IKB75_04605 [Clostridia bacterium]|nr:hypothetical protein [Clostridia bacterium]
MATNNAQAAYEFKQLLKNKTPEQEKVIRYFYNQPKGCFGKVMSDAEYDKMVNDFLAKNNSFKDKAISKIGLDESEISLIAPVCIKGYLFDDKKAYAKCGKDDKLWRSSMFQVSWIFFSETQVYLYQYTFNFDENGKKESSEEYFYKDVVNFSSSEETVEKVTWESKKGCLGKPGPLERVTREVENVRLSIVVPGDKMYCAATVTDDSFETSIKGMKNLLREKKNNG